MADFDTLPPALRPLIERFANDTAGFMLALQNGQLTIADWRTLMAEALARYHTAALMAGMGSTELTPELVALLENTVDVQVAFLDNFARVMEAAGADGQQWAMWNARAQQYALSPKSSWAEGGVIRQTGRVLPLPAMPAQGTQCGNNCLCRWKITQTAENSYRATWERHADDSCQTCIVRGQEWVSLIIEDGRLLAEGETVKHLGGRHDQKTHGFRFGSTPSLDKARQMRREGTWGEYKRRSRQRSGAEPSAKRVDAKERQYQQAQKKITQARKEYAGVKAQYDKAEHKVGLIQNKINKNRNELDRMDEKRIALQAKGDKNTREYRVFESHIQELERGRSWSEYHKDPRHQKAVQKLNQIVEERNKIESDYGKLRTRAEKMLAENDGYRKELTAARTELSRAERDLGPARMKYITQTKDARRVVMERGREKAEATRQEILKHEREYNQKRNNLINQRRKAMDDINNTPLDDPNYTKKAERLIEIDGKLRGMIGDENGPIMHAQRLLKQDPAKVDYQLSDDGSPKPFDKKIWESGAEEFNAYVGRNPLLESARPEIGLMTRDKGRKDDGRAYARDGDVFMAAGDRPGTVVHELGHVLEHHDPAILAESLRFVERRAGGEAARKLSEITNNKFYADWEVSRPDRFLHAYIGKSYGHNASEVLSMGLQMFYEDPLRLARLDPDYFDFLVSVVRMGF